MKKTRTASFTRGIDWLGLAVVVPGLLAPQVLSAEEWKVVSRTLAHADAPDSRQEVGIGEWVELSIVPETVTNIEWVVQGGKVTNRFGNVTILVVGFDPGRITVSARPFDKQPAVRWPLVEKTGNGRSPKWRGLQGVLEELKEMTDNPKDFDAACAKAAQALRPYQDRVAIHETDMPEFFQLLLALDSLWPRVPGSTAWAEIRSTTSEAAALRLADRLDRTPDKSKLGPDFWNLLHASIAGLTSLRQEYEHAGGDKSAQLEIFDGDVVINGVNQPVRDESSPEERRKSVANELCSCQSELGDLLRVQVRNAFPGVPRKELKDALGKQGFTEAEQAIVFPADDAASHRDKNH